MNSKLSRNIYIYIYCKRLQLHYDSRDKMIRSSVNLLARMNLPVHQFSLLKSVVLGHEF